MRRSLEDFLREEGGLTTEQIRDALRTRTFFGGSLLSNLVRLDSLGEEQAAVLLSRWTGYPPVSLKDLKNIPPEALTLLDRATAARRQVVPFRLDEETLLVATCRADNDLFFFQLEHRIGLKVVPHAALEDRIELLLERHYGLPPRRRDAVRPVAPDEDPFATASPETTLPPIPTTPSGPEIGIDGLPLNSEAAPLELPARPLDAWDTPEPHRDGIHPAAGGSDRVLPVEPRPEAAGAPSRIPVTSLQGLVDARDREAIGEAAVAVALAVGARRAALFSIQKDHVLSWAAGGDGIDASAFRAINIPLYAPSIFGVFRHTVEPYVGIVPDHPANRELLASLGGRAPKIALAVPVLLRNRPVAVLYVDRGAEAPEPLPVPPLRDLAARIALALEILLLKRKILS